MNGGFIDGRIGCMKSSKSWWLAEKYNKVTRGMKDTERVAVIVPAVDTRSAIHGSESRGSKLIVATHVIKTDALDEINVDEVCKKYDYFFFDETHFIHNAADLMVQLYLKGKTVYFSALDQNYVSEPWPETAKVLNIATQYQKLTAKCDTCESDASFTRLRPEFKSYDNASKVIIGSEPYMSVCLGCALEQDQVRSK